MRVETLDVEDEESITSITQRAAEVLQSGGLVVYPTDTSYGITCDIRIEEALNRLIQVKDRDPALGLPLLFSDHSQCEEYHEFDELERVLVKLFWPGAITLIVTSTKELPSNILGSRSSIAIRVPNHPIPRNIARLMGSPIIGTSANKSGGSSPFNVTTAKKQLGNEIDLYIDGGQSSVDKSSTMVRVESGPPANIKVYREGALSIERLEEALRGDKDALRFWTNRVIYADR